MVALSELNVKAAQEMLVSTLKWREQFKVDEVVKEEFSEDIFGKVGKVKGTDKETHPVTYVTIVTSNSRTNMYLT